MELLIYRCYISQFFQIFPFIFFLLLEIMSGKGHEITYTLYTHIYEHLEDQYFQKQKNSISLE